MKKFTYLAVAATSALVFTSCSSPEEKATDAVKDTLEDLTELVNENKDEDLETAIDELHSLLEKRTPQIISALEDLSDAERVTFINNVVNLPEVKTLTMTVMSAANSPVALSAAKLSDDPAAADAVLPMESRMKLVDICANLAKIGVALRLEREDVRDAFKKASSSIKPF